MSNSSDKALDLTGVYEASGVEEQYNGTYYMRLVEQKGTWNLYSFGVQNTDDGKGKNPNFASPLWSNVFWGNTGAPPSLDNNQLGVEFADVPLGENRHQGPFTIKITKASPITMELVGAGKPGGFATWVKQS